LRRLLPDRGESSVEEAIGALDFVAEAHDDRPYLVTNFALTIDGRATLSGRSGPIGSATDTAMLVGLRTTVDAVMIGAGTMRAERYGRPVGDPAKRERREREGLSHDPLMCLVSGSLDLPWDAELFTCGEGSVVIFTASPEEPPPTATPVHCERYEGTVDLVAAMRYLRREREVRALLCEGGPHVHAQLIEAGLVDELFVTHAPKLGGGEGPHLVSGLPERERPLDVAWLLEEDGELFARYRVRDALSG
jgi:riboflavin biosynthesis pyrimidine reductase